MLGIELKVSYMGDKQEVALVDAKGYIDSTTASEFTGIIDRQVNLGISRIIVNLKEISYISNSGWDALLSRVRKVRESGGDIVLTKMAKTIQDLFELMELSYVFKVYTTVSNAKTHFLTSVKRAETKPVKVPETLTDLRKNQFRYPTLPGESLHKIKVTGETPLN